MNSAIDVAKYVINKCNKIKNPISNLQLQKILYYIQGNFLAKFDRKLFDEDIEAWKYGPVVKDVYYEFNKYSSCLIRDTSSPNAKFIESEEENIDFIDKIIESKSKLSAWQLVEKTHEEAPWNETYNEDDHKVINSELIKDFFIKETMGGEN